MKPKTHDYSSKYWGHDYVFEPINGGLKGHMMGWGHGLSNGDFLILKNEDSTTRYKIDRVEYKDDPDDMWEATVTFAPRELVSSSP